MAKKYDDSVLDAALNLIKNNATTMVFCSAEPADYAGISAVALATVSGLTSGSFTGPADDTSGRKLTVNAQSGITPSSNGTITYVVLHDGSTLLVGTAVNSQAVLTSQSWSSPAWDINLEDPA